MLLIVVLPCICLKCGRYISSQLDEECQIIEEKDICKTIECDECDFECERFTVKIIPLKKGKLEDIV